MAIRQTKSGTWQVYWRNPISKKLEAKNYKTKQEAIKENKVILYRLCYDIESFREIKSLLFKDIYEEFLKDRNLDALCEYRHRKRMKYSLEILGDKEIKDITTEDLYKVKESLEAKVSQATVHDLLSTLKAVYHFIIKQEYKVTAEFPVIPDANYKKFIPPTMEELRLLYDVSPDHLKRVLVLGAFFGVRVGVCELFQLTWEDVDLNKEVLRIHGSKKNLNAQYREVPIKKALLPIFQQWSVEDKKQGYLVNYNNKQIKSVKSAWKTALKKAGITRRIRPYDLRHTFATELIASGVDVGTVAALMGHSNPTMLLKYYQYVSTEQKKLAVEKLTV